MVREIKRGDVYYIRYDDSYGSELAVGRPFVVVSRNEGNEYSATVLGVLMTTVPKTNIVSVPIKSTNRPSWVVCNQIRTYDKARFGDYMCTLPEEEMAEIDSTIAYALGLKLADASLEEKHRQEIEVATAQLNAQLVEKDKEIAALMAKHDEETIELKEKYLECSIESEVNLRLYEKAIEMMCEKRLAADVSRVDAPKPAKVEEKPAKAAEKPKKETVKVEAPPVEPSLVDLNSCTENDLVNIGIDRRVAKMVIANRPYANVEELRYVDGITKIGYGIVKTRVKVGCYIPPVEEKKPVAEVSSDKVNVNTATWQEMRDKAGLNFKTAQYIVSYRNKHGRYTSLDELLNVERWGPKCAIKYNDKLTV